MDAGPAAADPSMTGPYTITQIDGTFTVTASGDSVPMHGAYPTAGPTAGPYPVVVLAHGFQLPVTEYVGYLEALASFGYVALTADYPDPLLGPIDNVEDAQDISGGLDWASTDSTLAGLVDLSKAGVMGHSRGGNGAVLAASMDPRFLAVLGLDPVAASPTSATCPDARVAMAGLHIPSLLMGETLDGSGGLLGMSCAPLALDYQTFYAAANSPSIQVTVNGANHMSFLDNPSTCGIVCGACQTATADHTTVINMLFAFTVAFFERNLRGNTGDQTYLTGAEAQSRYTPALISIVSK